MDSAAVMETAAEPFTKVKRTYGRKKETNGGPGTTAPPVTVSSASVTAAHPLFSNEISPLEGDRAPPVEQDETDVFGLRRTLDVIDKYFDDGTLETGSGRLALDMPRISGTVSTSPISPDHDSSSNHDDSLFSNQGPTTSSQSEDQPLAIAKLNQSMKATSIKGSGILDAQPTSSSPPYGSHLADSPKPALSTPLTSDDEKVQNPSSDHESAAYSAKRIEERSSRIQNLGEIPHKKSAFTSAEGKASKIKRLTKKEQKESRMAHARLMADQKVSVSKRTEQFSISQFLGKIEKHTNGTSSDPIQDFTSSPMDKHLHLADRAELEAGPSRLQDCSDEELPDMTDVMKAFQDEKQKSEAQVKRIDHLAVIKQRALERKDGNDSTDTESDDLEIVEGSVTMEDNPKPRVISDYEKRLSGIAGFSVGKSKPLRQSLDNSQGERYLRRAAKPNFGSERSRQASAKVGHRSLKAAMFDKASKQSLRVTKEKEQEWVRSGGKLSKTERNAPDGSLSISDLAKKLADRRKEGTTYEAAASESDSDSEYRSEGAAEDYDSEDGLQEKYSGESDNDGNEEALGQNVDDAGTPIVSKDQSEAEEDDLPIKPHRAKQARRALISDSDEEGNVERKGRLLVPDTSMILNDSDQQEVTSLNDVGTDEENKENERHFLFQGGEDKENMVIRPPSPVLQLRKRASKLGDCAISPLSVSPEQRILQKREPLQAKILDDFDDPPDSPSLSPKSRSPGTGLKSPTEPFAPALLSDKGGFSQFFDEDDNASSRRDAPYKGLLQPAFLLQPSPKAKSPTGTVHSQFRLGELSSASSPRRQKFGFANRMGGFNKEELSLTLDTNLQPALEINTQARQKADSIFDKEQLFVLEEATDIQPQDKRDFYVTDAGLLTQTRPDSAVPASYSFMQQLQARSPTAASETGSTLVSGHRQPLSTLSLLSQGESPRLSRLVKGKGRAKTPDISEAPLLLGSTASSNAFEKLLKGAQKQKKKEKKRLERSEYVEGEAQESDEDEMFGFGVASKDDGEESEEEDPNAVVEGLVDDAHLTAEQVAEDKVFEKVKEQAEEDDAVLEKYHQAAIEGKYRSKRRGGGLAMDDSDSDEDDDDEARRARRRMHKKRRIEGDTLEALGKDEKSRAFYEAYQRDVQEDDNDDFAHLNNDEMEEDVEGDENEPPEVVTTSEIQARLREVAREQKSKETEYAFDPDNIDWAEPTYLSDDEFDVKEVDNQPKKIAPRRPAFGQVDNAPHDDILPKHSDSWNEMQLANWRKEQSGRNPGTGGTRGAITVTGHGKKSGTGLTRPGSTSSARESAAGKRGLAKASSILAKVSDRQSRFD